MKRKSKILSSIAVLAIVFTILTSSMISYGATTIENTGCTDATVNVANLNLRQGPTTSSPVICILKKSQALKVLGKMDTWYLVFDPLTNCVGAVNGNYITPVTANSINVPKLPDESPSVVQNPVKVPSDISNDEQRVLTLANNTRKQNGAGDLQFDSNLAKVARDKAKDMVINNYFSHQSPTYGSPFEMMRKYGISFTAAGENIAGNQTMDNAFAAWMKSEGHKKNILNGNYNATGIGVYNSPVYGKIIVQMFIRK